MESKERLTILCAQAFQRKKLDAKHKLRLKLELSYLKKQDEYDYFLDLVDAGVRYGKNQNNLLIPYLLGIVDEFNINSEPTYVYGEFPDVDCDYIDEVRDYLKNDWAPKTFGRENVCNIGSYNTYAMRSALLDTAKVFGKDRDEMLVITKVLPSKDEEGNAITWEQALAVDPMLKEFCNNNPEIYDIAKRLTESEYGRRNKSMGKHAGGLIVSCKRVDDVVPLVLDRDGLVTSAWTEGQHAQELGPLGYIKFDLLSIANLKQIAFICHLIKKRRNIDSICALPGQRDWSDTSYLNDPKALEMANLGDLKGVFQFDANPGIRMLARDGGVTSFDDLVAYTCVFRPGPLGALMDKAYVKRKRGEEEYELHPLLEPIVGRTYGIMIYQEQVMQILHAIGDIPLADCEKVRKAISKKKVEIFGEYKEQFLRVGGERLKRDCKPEAQVDTKGVIGKLFDPAKSLEENESKVADYAFNSSMANPYAKAMGYVSGLYKLKYPSQFITINREYLIAVVAKANARYLWEQIEAFAGYGFNLSHAVAYSYVSSRLLNLKVHFPIEFYAGILKYEKKEDKIKEYKTEALIHGIQVKFVDINMSKARFEIGEDGAIYFGFANIKGIGDSIAEKIVEGQPYESFEDFLNRFGTEAKVIKPLLALKIFKDSDPETLYKYYEDFKVATKARVDKARRYEQAMERYDNDLLNLLNGDHTYFGWENGNLATWQELFNKDEIIEELCGKPGPNYGKMIQKKFNRWKKIKSLYDRRTRAIEDFEKKEKEANENPFTFDKFRSELSQVYVPQELKAMFENKEEAEKNFLGFRWDHPLEKCAGYTGKTFSQLRTEDGPIPGPVEVLVVEHKKIEWKNGKGFNYRIQVEDANGEKSGITVWPDDWERFKEEFTQSPLLRIRVQVPSKYGYTLDGPPKWKRNQLPDKDRDYRVVVIN